MTEISTEIFILVLLLLANGFFALSEMAIVAARKARLKQLADDGNARANTALQTAMHPTRFLSTVQVAITLMTLVTGVFGGETLASHLTTALAQIPWLEPYSRKVALAVVVIGLTTFNVVLGELVPKRLALAFPERFAMWTTPVVNFFSVIVAPLVTLLTFLTERFLRLIGLHKAPKEAPVSDEEVNILIEQGMSAGVFNKNEQDMVAGVLALDQMAVTAIMTPRPKIIFLNIEDSDEINWRKIVTSGHSYFPVFKESPDHVLGMIAVKALWAHSAIGVKTNLKDLLVEPLVIPETMASMHLLEAFKKSGKHIALVTDEFGAVQGLVTLIDVLEAIVGDLPPNGQKGPSAITKREDGSWLVDATVPIGDIKDLLSLDELPNEDDADFQTLGGLVITSLGKIPVAGNHFDYEGWRFEVVDMDRHRVDKVLIGKSPVQKDSAENEETKEEYKI